MMTQLLAMDRCDLERLKDRLEKHLGCGKYSTPPGPGEPMERSVFDVDGTMRGLEDVKHALDIVRNE